ncbi:thiamine ABC transporter substrate-binding protein [Pasteurellaceae bacterium Macca]|nr:thiamine ABC transporter substrate-binding protein [Pasteurellaceae bacterium Macca]
MKFTSLLPLSFLAITTVASAKPILNVYSYDSFAGEWGAAPKLKPLFEAQCGCEVKFFAFQDGVTMFNRLRLEGKKTKADVVVGLAHFTLPEAEKSGLFQASGIQSHTPNLPITWQNDTFIPFDYGEYAFIYAKQKLANPPKSLKALVERQDLKVIYQDPRTSLVGRGLLYWLNSVYGEQAEQAWQQLAQHTVTVGKGWSETYGAFLKGEADLVLSYTTSPLYHQWHDKTDDYVAAQFEEGHLLQIETAALSKFSKQPDLARQFLRFLQQPEAQQMISYHNVMKPINQAQADAGFNTLPRYTIRDFPQPTGESVKKWLATWQAVLAK